MEKEVLRMMSMRGLNVHSEIGPLRRVVLHRLGKELVNFRVEDFDRVWSHGAFFLERAQQEHEVFAHLLQNEGVEVLYLEDLVVEALDAVPGARQAFMEQAMRESMIASPAWRAVVRERLDAITDTREFVRAFITGFPYRAVEPPASSELTLADLEATHDPAEPLLIPLPGLQFSRDPLATVGQGVLLNHMCKPQRNREVILYETIFRYHPDYAEAPIWYEHEWPCHIEGGDVLNIDAHTLAIGLSDRTEPGAIDRLAQNLFWGDEASEIEAIYAFTIPHAYALMHLDTVFTQVDVDAFTVYPGIYQTLRVYRLTRGAKPGSVRIERLDGSLTETLAVMTGQSTVRLIEVAGGDPIEASREQWNDGSNTLAVAPGVVCVYERNVITNDVLDKAGFRLLVVPSEELSLGRGGPRCMSMPFWRDEL